MKFVELTNEEYKQFVDEHFSHYTQTDAHFTGRKKLGLDVQLVGVKENDTVIAACLLTKARVFKLFNYFYTHKGPVLDHNNQALVDFFYRHLTIHLKKQRGLFALVDPYITRNYLNGDGELIKAFDNQPLIKHMHNLGYKHQGYPIGYLPDSQARFFSVLDIEGLSEQDILKNMDYNTRRSINLTEKMGVRLVNLTVEEMPRFYELYQMAEEKHDFKLFNLTRYQEIVKIYGENARVVLAYINLDDHLSYLEKDLQEKLKAYETAKIKLEERPNDKRANNIYRESEVSVKSVEKKIEVAKALQNTEGNILDLASSIFIHNNHEMYYLASGSNPKYNQFMGSYYLQWQMIQEAKALQLKRYNFYGVTGDFNPETSEDYGVALFKKGFNAYIDEQVGDFIKVLNPLAYRLYQFIYKK